MLKRYLIYISETNGISLVPITNFNIAGIDAYQNALRRNGENQYNTIGIYVEIFNNNIWKVEKLVLDN